MNKDIYRITARIRRADGVEKTITFRGNFGNMDQILRESFHANLYKLYKINETRINAEVWERVKSDDEITADISAWRERMQKQIEEEGKENG